MMLRIAGALADRGHQVDFVLARSEIECDLPVPPEVRLVTLGARHWMGAVGDLISGLTGSDYFGRTMKSLPPLVEYLRRESPVALVAGSANNVAAWGRALSGVRTRVVATVSVHLSTHLANLRRRRLRLWSSCYRKCLRQADAFVAKSKAVRDDLVHNFGIDPARIWVIYNPVVTAEMLEEAECEAPHPWLSAGGMPVVMGAGRLSKEKGFDTLIRAFALVRKSREARLIVLGSGPERARLAALADQMDVGTSVDFPGYKANPYAYMARSSVFVLSSLAEGFGNVLAEALALGTPVVSTDCPGGPCEILDGGRYGRLVPVGNAQAMARAILETINIPPRRDLLKMRGRTFSLEAAVPKYIEAMGMTSLPSVPVGATV